MSMNFGELIPATCVETVPGDHIEMHASNLLRAIPMVTSPFMRAKQHIDVWFVPYRDLWHNFDSFMTKKDQPVSSALSGASFLPHINSYTLWSQASLANLTDIVGRDYASGAKRLLNYLGYGYQLLGSSSTDMVDLNPFRLAAYNYIWYNEYRQGYYDSALASGLNNAALLFNFDDLACTSQATSLITGTTRLQQMCQMRYRCWKKDLYTGLLPSTQFGAVSSINTSNFLNIRFVGDQSVTGSLNPNVYNASAIDGYNKTVVFTDSNSVSSTVALPSGQHLFDVLSLRRSEAVQIWRENSLRAGNRVSDNMRAHYGIESDFRDHRPTYLGSVSAPLNIGDVMTTANGDYSGNTNPNTNVGDVAGKGLSSLDEKVFTFDSKDFGVIMAIASILPEAEYNARGISRMNQLLEAEDFFVPEYENLGLEAVSSQNFVHVPASVGKVVGYAPRYYGYKTKLDKCYDLFMTGGLNAPWTSPKYDVSQVMGTPGTVIPLSTLYVNPKIFDVNFAVSVDIEPQFLADFYFDVDAVRPMSVVGLPFS